MKPEDKKAIIKYLDQLLFRAADDPELEMAKKVARQKLSRLGVDLTLFETAIELLQKNLSALDAGKGVELTLQAKEIGEDLGRKIINEDFKTESMKSAACYVLERILQKYKIQQLYNQNPDKPATSPSETSADSSFGQTSPRNTNSFSQAANGANLPSPRSWIRLFRKDGSILIEGSRYTLAELVQDSADRGLDFSFADFSHCLIDGNRQICNLTGVRFKDIIMQGAVFTDAILDDVVFENPYNLKGIIFKGAKSAKRLQINISQENRNLKKLSGIDFSGLDMEGSLISITSAYKKYGESVQEDYLSDWCFREADLRRAEISVVFVQGRVSEQLPRMISFEDWDFSRADVREIVFRSSGPKDYSLPILGGKFQEILAQEAKFTNLVFFRSDWSDALIENAGFRECHFDKGIFTRADISDVKFSESVMNNCVFQDTVYSPATELHGIVFSNDNRLGLLTRSYNWAVAWVRLERPKAQGNMLLLTSPEVRKGPSL